jgi:hypothetical protein
VSSALIEALVLAAVLSILIALIEITSKSHAGVLRLLRGRFWLYLATLGFGNMVATLLASTTPPPEKFPLWLWSAFIGVFGFEVLIQNINVTLAGKGVLTISDWINKARDSAIADAVEAETDFDAEKIQVLAKRLAQLPLPTLNTHVAALLSDPNAVATLTQKAQAQGLNEALLKALTLATANYKTASQIT